MTPSKSHEYRLYKKLKHGSTEICKDSDNSRRLMLLTKNEKRVVLLQMLQRRGKKGFCPSLHQACKSQRLCQDTPASSLSLHTFATGASTVPRYSSAAAS